jgi:phosphatidylserine/phosphatidylglycerophosphate/cardiolipin synthase-like enzyme
MRRIVPVVPRAHAVIGAAVLVLVAGACQRRLPSRLEPAPGGASGAPPALAAAPEPAPTPGDAILPESALLEALLAALPQAQRRVWTAQYTLWDGQHTARVYAALEDAAARGVDVRVLADEEADDTPDRLEALADAGAQTRLDDRAVTTHHKLWVIDDVVITGSHNLSDSGLVRNAELSARTADVDVVDAAAARFDALWQDPEARPAAAAQPDTGRPAQLYVDDEVLGGLLHCVDNAQLQVDLAIYAIAWDARYPGSGVDLLLTALEAAHRRGVAVQVVLDDSDWVRDNGINAAAVDRLRAAGVPTRRADPDALVHAKSMVCDHTVLVSDANWSYSGLDLYHGATLALRDPARAAEAQTWIEDLWAAGQDR